ncbi:MAG: glycerol-3-phosphate acyltransferase [Tepidiformaceae bacterium]
MFKPLIAIWKVYKLYLAGVAGYLMGSILTADLATRAARLTSGKQVDLRAVGSGNPGAANAIYTLGARWATAILAGDMAKGAVAAQVGRIIAGDSGAYFAATAAVAGHCFPAFNGFRGGKGVATSAGTTFVVFPAYVPVDFGVVGVSWVASKHTGKATAAGSSLFVLAAFLWKWRRWPTLWGTRPTWGLPLYAIATTAMISYRFLSAPKHFGTGPVEPPSKENPDD